MPLTKLALLAWFTLCFFLGAGCGDESKWCVDYCEGRGGLFLSLDNDRCLCSYSDGFDGGTD